ncbi:hypothetical protein FTUN_7022 [Frigoriglobus tundricola]|uniref:Uncharacterized protein n=1 Tax=Frigoriglobus tundricola TaxID=2774151 RepID=A0A6M5Z190_9BACT|nr:hypothetical protein FTUN_7022 [Frigoriglobus tundricola]
MCEWEEPATHNAQVQPECIVSAGPRIEDAARTILPDLATNANANVAQRPDIP